ncbi:hypothetical protein AB0K47_27640 [Streptomyces tirandamycinicus]|uniref:hypothetical protein n=1 Tax=Streptomyces tirandamycinicus TaxID=2174846 RepID=UPI00343141A5
MYVSTHSGTDVRVGGPDAPSRPAAPAGPATAGAGEPCGTGGTGNRARTRRWPYALGGALLVLVFLGMCVLGALMATSCYELVREGSGMCELYLQSALFAGMGFIGLCALPVIAERNRVVGLIARRIPW